MGSALGHCGSHVIRKTLVTQQGQQGVQEKSNKPVQNKKGTPGHHGEMLGFRESVPTTSSLGTARHPAFMSAAAQCELSCSRKDKRHHGDRPLGITPIGSAPDTAVPSEHLYTATYSTTA